VQHGYVIVPDFMSSNGLNTCTPYAQQLKPPANGNKAGIGRADQYTTNTAVRQDRIRWLQRDFAAEASYLGSMDELRLLINYELFMGLFDYECHLAHYPPGAFYRKHVDAFKGRSNRIFNQCALP